MTRFLRRTTTTDTSADDQNAESAAPLIPPETPARTGLQSPIDPPAKSPSRRGGRRRSSANGSPASKTEASPANKPAPRRATRRSTQDKPSDPEEKMLALLERQTTLLEQQGKSIERMAESQALLTDTLLGRRGEDHPPGRIEVLPRLAIFVDVPNILYGAESSGVRLNWGKVADFLSHGRTLVRAIAYAPISDDPTQRTENERFVVPFLDHGYRIATKPLKRFTGGSVKANFDVELAIDVLTMSDRVDVIVLVSGDGDFRRLVEIVGARGVRVEVMAFGKSTSSDLRQVADRYIDIAQYADQLRD
ncbi:MAG: NYN domain-containing protein [Chloroflexi bacterium]|nr:NYN domain-containing protein [Chloroflexota bacterium]MYI04757.1 NYN domain-containing protein [Chloroflexota bacterium]